MKNTAKKLLAFAAFFILATVMFIQNAFAYIDPSAMTFIIQIIAGVAIAAGAAFGFYWRKFRRAVTRKKRSDDYDEDDDESAHCSGLSSRFPRWHSRRRSISFSL